MPWQIVETEKSSAEQIMKKDEQLLAAKGSDPVLHLYSWATSSATYGYFCRPEEWLLSQEGLDLARRPTGGGITFHVADYAFSLVMPASSPYFSKIPLENYRFVNRCVVTALQSLFPAHYEMLETGEGGFPSFCMRQGTKYDVFCEGKKAVGAAQRTKAWGYLHQGFISLTWPRKEFLMRYLSPPAVEQMRAFTFAPLGEEISETTLKEGRKAMKEALYTAFVGKV